MPVRHASRESPVTHAMRRQEEDITMTGTQAAMDTRTTPALPWVADPSYAPTGTRTSF